MCVLVQDLVLFGYVILAVVTIRNRYWSLHQVPDTELLKPM